MDNLEVYSVWRLDDNGNHFEIQDNLPLKEAEDIRQNFENLGHKQLYYLEKTAHKNSKTIDKISSTHVQ